MKVLRKKDLIFIISSIEDRSDFDLIDMTAIFNRYGDDYFAEDGEFKLTNKNKKIDELKEMLGANY